MSSDRVSSVGRAHIRCGLDDYHGGLNIFSIGFLSSLLCCTILPRVEGPLPPDCGFWLGCPVYDD